MDGYSSVPLVELVYSDGGDCQLGCAFAVDDVQSVGTVVASNRAAAGLPDIEFAERYEASYTVTELSPEGPMQVHVSFYEDQSGNAGDLYLSEGGVVEIDTTPPSVLGIDAWSSGDDMNFAKAGDVITVYEV